MESTAKSWFGILVLASVTITIHSLTTCGNGEAEFEVWGGYCYYFYRGLKGKTFKDAQTGCEKIGATVASIHSREENEYIFNKLNKTLIMDYWIGLVKDNTDKPVLKDNYYWVDGSEKVYENWAPKEPNDAAHNEDCVDVRTSSWANPKQWNDVYCTYRTKAAYVCKVKPQESWVTYSGSEYFISYKSEDTQLNWYDARQWCMNNGADLVSLTSPAEASQVATWANSNAFQGGLWVGANRLQGDRQAWSWSDGSSWSFTNWESGYPDDDNYGQHCAFQQSSNTEGKWRNGHCDEANKGFICKRPPASGGEPTPKTDPVTPKVSGHCPAGFIGSGNKCFMVKAVDHDEGLSFSDAVNFCRQQDGYQPDLASITSPLDQAFVTSQLQTITFGVWIGLHRRPTSSNDAWLWVDNGPTSYDNWAPNEPSDYDDHCVEVQVAPGPIGSWVNINCTAKKGYVCQTYKNPDRPINTPPATTPHTCPHPFTPYWYGCYLYIETMQSWSAAQQECRGKDTNANLVGIHHEAENAAVSTILLNNNVNHIWTGFVDQDKSGEYKWMDGWVTFYTNWAEGQPRRENDGAGCVRMSTDGTWSDAVCSLQMPSVCKISQIGAVTTPSTKRGRCPGKAGWEEYHEHCYYFAPNASVDWDSAGKECQELGFGATLASIHNDLENTYIYDTLHKKGGGRASAWIGMYRSQQDMTFRWSDLSSIQYEAWAPGKPNVQEQNENCVEMYNEYWPSRWNDHYCNDMKGYVCKAPKTPEMTSNVSYCPSGWSYYERACYLFQPDVLVKFHVARAICQAEGGETADLASIHDWEENMFIGEEMYSTRKVAHLSNYFIGMSKLKAGEPYLWTDSSEVDFEHWAPTKPNDEDGDDENCVEADINTGRWDDVNCNQVRGVVCKISIGDEDNSGAPGLSGRATAGILIVTLIVMVNNLFMTTG